MADNYRQKQQELLDETAEKTAELLAVFAVTEADMFAEIFDTFNDGSMQLYSDREKVAKSSVSVFLVEINNTLEIMFPYEKPLTGRELWQMRREQRSCGSIPVKTDLPAEPPYFDNQHAVLCLMKILQDTEQRCNRYITAWNTHVNAAANAKTQAEYDSHLQYLLVESIKKDIASNCFIGISGKNLEEFIYRNIEGAIRL